MFLLQRRHHGTSGLWSSITYLYQLLSTQMCRYYQNHTSTNKKCSALYNLTNVSPMRNRLSWDVFCGKKFMLLSLMLKSGRHPGMVFLPSDLKNKSIKVGRIHHISKSMRYNEYETTSWILTDRRLSFCDQNDVSLILSIYGAYRTAIQCSHVDIKH